MYTVTETLHESSRTLLYRGLRDSDRRPVVLKVLAPGHRPQDLERLRHEYQLLGTLHLPPAVAPLALDTFRGMPALVMEDFGGASLDGQLGPPMETGRFLPLAIRLTAAVAELHQRNVIHKDLKPQNVLVHPGTGEVKLVDFGIASRLPDEHGPIGSTRWIEGSLPYMSPEQTGRMNRSLDQRSDLYSLGITFYEMLTGRLPFEAEDPLEWVHCHIARSPLPPADVLATVPEAISAIVMKLLAKQPEERFQSAAGLQRDLETCLAQWRASGSIAPFPPGERDDGADRFQIPRKLYGRNEEQAALLAAFERVVATGTPELMKVSGYAGIGKSSLVHELHKPIVAARGLFASGKAAPYQRDIPYALGVQAVRELVLDVLAGSEESIAEWKQRLQAALGNHGQLIVDVIPPVEHIIGRQPPVPELPPTEAHNRFRTVFRHFIGVFAQKPHPLTLFLDDLQWADSGSLALLVDLLTHPELRYLFVVGAYRDNEVSASHPLMLMLERLRKAAAHVSSIVLRPLQEAHLAAFLGDALHCLPEEAGPLARLLEEKTAGNPFFAIQFLTALHDEHLIAFDASSRAWHWDIEKIRAKGFTDNVAELMAGKLQRLPTATQEALKLAAGAGSSVELELPATLLGRDEEETRTALWEAVRAGLLVCAGRRYTFVHDRVREAAYALIPEESRAAVHLRIGRFLMSRFGEAPADERLFDLVTQLNRGAGLIVDERERALLCRLDFRAGRRAKASSAYASAVGYLTQAARLLPPEAWSTHYEETLALHLELAESEVLVGHFQQADMLFSLMLEKARTHLDRVEVWTLRMRMYQVIGRPGDGVTLMLEGLRLFGMSLPDEDSALGGALEAEQREVSLNLRGRRIADLVDAPVATDPNVRAIIRLLVTAMPCANIGRPRVFPLIVMRALNLSLRHGNTEDSCFTYSAYGTLLISVFGDIPSAFEFSEMSIRLNEKFGDLRQRGIILYLHAHFIHCWRKPMSTVTPILERVLPAFLDVGEFVFASYHGFWSTWLAVERGDTLDDVLREARKYVAFARESHNDVMRELITAEQQFVASLKGRTRELASFDDEQFSESECHAKLVRANFGTGLVALQIAKQVSAFIFGRYDEALACAGRVAPEIGAVLATTIEATHHFYHALTLAALHPRVSEERQREFARLLTEELRRHELWARHCPENYQNRFALVSAEVARIEGRELDAERRYEEAIRSARDNGFVQNEALACELASKFYRGRGLPFAADAYLREARSCYSRWGADEKVRQLDQHHPQVRESQALAPAATFAARAEQLDLLSVVKASQTISGELVLDKLVRTLLQVVLEQCGARRGALIIPRDGELTLEAEAAFDEQGVTTKLLPSVPAASSSRVPISLIQYVRRTRERVILNDAVRARYASDPYLAREKPRSVLCLPVLRQAEVVAILYLENNLVSDAFTPERLATLELLATQAAISLENALLLAKEQAARTAAEEAERRAAFLAEAGQLLSESLDSGEILARFSRLCVRSFADWCLLDVLEAGGELQRVAAAHSDAQQRSPPGWDSPPPALSLGIQQAVEPSLLPEVSDASLRTSPLDESSRALLQALGAHTAMVVPLVARGQHLGVLTLASAKPGRPYGREDLELARELAQRAAIAIDNTRLHRRTLEALRLREEFLSVASHELNTPMTSLSLSLQSVLRATRKGRTLEPDLLDRTVDLAWRQGQRLNRLIGELLDVSRIESGSLVLELSEVDLASLAREVVQRFTSDLTQTQSSVTIRGAPSVMGRWDRSRIDQVLTNLLSNALKFGGGKPIEIDITQDNGTARLAVTDRGIGIDSSRQARIFERFERAVSVRHYGGLGLGLYICRRIVEAHGGSIRVESHPAQGATFTVELPRMPPPEAADTRPASTHLRAPGELEH
ncbi:ATP-binding sensor histidine kinase [Myxococcus sp. RHSTA-1-4]|uniref:ATP-binding sensor histidine kinase n=1 Tax=Myxococcus sp. RHSTA-1-4 TaxID=2874601 RepID=UPI001CBF7CD5|nr:ATP-binding sensor histidine kinase [Myxococcus sp. RHSTA-1-4]MBZ4418354.1 AAA family ATPase [Myxococcus sp. RHSTA-1-4]